MSRSGYSEDYESDYPNAYDLYRKAVANAINGRRGQAFFRDLADALDALPEKRLIAHELQKGGEVCALGALGSRRCVEMTKLDPEDVDGVATTFGIPPSLAREVVYENDEAVWKPETPEERWVRMRAWVAYQIRTDRPA